MVEVALVVKLVAKQDRAADLAAFLTAGLDLAEQEPDTITWLALQTDATTFWIVDAFPGEDGRQAHLNGPIAAALMDKADELLAEAPQILPADVLAAKLPS